RAEEAPRPPGRASAQANDVLLTNHAFELFCRAGRRAPRLIPRLNRLVTALAGRSERLQGSAALFATPRPRPLTRRGDGPPRRHVPQAVRAVMEMIERRGFAVPFPIEVRSVAADDALLSTAAGRDSGF